MYPGFNPFQNLPNLLSSFSQFKSNFQGDPRQKVQELLNSGQMSPEQFNQLQTMAKQFENLLR
jgi:hypothetical protein